LSFCFNPSQTQFSSQTVNKRSGEAQMALGGIGMGIGSGMDIRSMVDALVNAEKAPKEAQLNRLEKATTTKVSALGQFRSALSSFETALKDLNSASLFQQRSAVSANTDAFTATAGSKAVA